jgi:hypothetical protein
MLAKDPKSRHQTPAQVATALEPFLSELVALPAEEEMPLLSPAAMDGSAPLLLPASAPAPVQKPVAVATASATATAVRPAPSASPFGSSAVSPWPTAPWQPGASTQFGGPPKSASRPTLPPLPPTPAPYPAQIAVETVIGGDHTPPAKRSNPYLGSNPFAADAPAGGAKKTSWPLVAVGIAIIVLMGILLARFTR